MKLHVGQRLHGTGTEAQPGGYVVTEVVAETPWFGLYGGKKIFANFDFAAKRVRETDDKEWLDVFLRTVRYPLLADPVYVTRRRTQARGEVRRLGVRQSNLWPEPLDLLEVDNTQDRFAFDDADPDREPVVVFARPHGKLLGEWLMAPVPGASVLSVLAEVLAFIGQAHAEGLLLNGLGPATLLIDRADRIHYLGGDLAVEAEQSKDLDAAGWLRLFPMERYPRGFAPPECFQGVVERRSDLFTWGALAISLLTGQRPWQIALEQGQSWAHFQEPHFTKLAQALRDLPPVLLGPWAEQLGVAPDAMLKSWPATMVGLLRRLLHPDPRRRPASVAELQAWLQQPPHPPEGPLVAFFRQQGQARLFLDLPGAEPGSQLIVQRGVGSPPRSIDEGARLYAGVYHPSFDDPQVPLTTEPIYYTAFLQPRDRPALDLPALASAELREGSPAALRRWAEALAAEESPPGLPPSLALAFTALGPLLVGEALLASQAAPVRAWGCVGLASVLRTAERPGPETLLTKALHDPSSEPRRQAARVLLEAADPKDDTFALGLLRTMGGDDLEDALNDLQGLRELGVRPDQLARVQTILEGERPATCPVCNIQLPHRERSEHLRQVHGFIDVAGHVLPRDQAVPRLWDRVFDQTDRQAQDKLLSLFAFDLPGYVTALEQDLVRRPLFAGATTKTSLPEEVQAGLKAYWSTLRPTSGALEAGRHLLGSILPLAREIGRETVLPLLAERYKTGRVQVADLRRTLDQLCPGPEQLEERVTLAGRLAAVGIDADAALACLAELQLERRVNCDVCAAKVRLADLETHLRRAHKVYQFRGVRQSYEATRGAILETVCGGRPDLLAFSALEELARDQHPEKSERHLMTWLCRKLRETPKGRRGPALHAVAQALAQAPALPRFLPILAGPMKTTELEPAARVLALETAARLEQPPPPELLTPLKPLLANKTLPRLARENAVVGLLTAIGKNGGRVAEVLEAYIAGVGKLRAIDKLHDLEKRVGQSPVLDHLVARLEDQVRMDCPRCGAQLQRKDMVKHLWDRHRLVLEGRRVREPWHQLADWIVDYKLEKDPAILQRSRELALRADPDQGRDRLQRLLLRHGVADRDALQMLLAQARQAHAGLCPACFANVPVAADPPLASLIVEDNALSGFGYTLSLSDGGLVPQLEIETPQEVLYRGREPGRLLTPFGGMVFLVMPAVVLIFLGLFLAAGRVLPLPVVIAMTAGAALILAGLNYLCWPRPAPPPDRLVDAAWRDLVPALDEAGWPREALQFAVGLCQLSRDAGAPEERAEAIQALRKRWGSAGPEQEQAQLPLVAVNLLAIEDATVTGDHDPLLLLADEVGRALAGKIALRVAARLLHEWLAVARKEPLRRRLVALVQGRAFSLGLEVMDLIDLAKVHAAWPLALGLEDLDLLGQRRLMWSLRGLEPWRRWTRAATAFELAETGDERVFGYFPGLLIFAPDSGIVLTHQGIRFADVLLEEGPKPVDVVRVKDGYEIQIGAQRAFFRDNPNRLADELERWQAFTFRDFLPQVAAVANRPPSDLGKALRKANSVPCPSCGRWLLTRAGEVGVLASGEG